MRSIVEVSSKPNPKHFILAAGILVSLSLSLQFLSIFAYPLSFDEGVHLITAKLIRAGYKPYTQVFVGYPPMFIIILSFAWNLGQSVLFSKIIFILINSLLLLILLSLGQHLLNQPAALLSLLLLILAPRYVANALAILADIPAVLFGSLALWSTFVYLRTTRRSLLLLAGVCFALTTLTKLLMPFVPLLVGFMLLFAYSPLHRTASNSTRSLRPILIEISIFAGGFVSTLLLFSLFFDFGQVYDSTVRFRLALRSADGFDLADNWTELQEFLVQQWPLSCGVLLSLFYLYKLPFRVWGLLLAWLALALGWVMVQIPLRAHHLVLLLPPMALLAGWGFWQTSLLMADGLKRIGVKHPWLLSSPTLVVSLFIIGFGLSFHYHTLLLQADYLADRQIPKRLEEMSGRQDMLYRTSLSTSPYDCVISDDPVLLLDLNRLPPPELAEPSIARIEAKYLTTQKVIEAADRYGCQAVIVTKGRFKSLPTLRDRLLNNFFLVSEKDIKMYSIKKDTPQQPQTRLEQRFVNGVTLVGVDLIDHPLKAGQQGFVSFYWQLENEVTTPYKVFMHIRDKYGKTVFQLDHFSFDNEVPVSIWLQRATLKDTNWFEIPETLGPGEYKLLVGLYYPDTGQRIALHQDHSGENAAVVGKIIVQ